MTFDSFGVHFIVCNAVCGGIISLNGCLWLYVAHLVEGDAYRFRFLTIVKRGPTSASTADPITFSLCLILFVHIRFFLYCFLSFGTPWRSALLLCWGPLFLISRMRLCGFSVSCHWSYSVVSHLDGLQSSLKLVYCIICLCCSFWFLCCAWSKCH